MERDKNIIRPQCFNDEQAFGERYFRKVLITIPKTMQCVSMHLNADEEIPTELHHDVDQLFVVLKGAIEITISQFENKMRVVTGGVAIVPRGRVHTVYAIKDTDLYTVYCPPEHPSDRIDKYPPKESPHSVGARDGHWLPLNTN
jgi:mannose-6-phosphate isomerase-like protein (cupin superfamily)